MVFQRYMLWVIAVLIWATCPLFAQSSQIGLDEAFRRIENAKQILSQDRALLERARANMKPQQYVDWSNRLQARERLILSKEKSLKEKSAQIASEKKVREENGSKFFEAQEKYYQYIDAESFDLRLD